MEPHADEAKFAEMLLFFADGLKDAKLAGSTKLNKLLCSLSAPTFDVTAARYPGWSSRSSRTARRLGGCCRFVSG